ncbi:MAG TPA: hypothetical protein VI299_17140 [Polyangiales bacterium]
MNKTLLTMLSLGFASVSSLAYALPVNQSGIALIAAQGSEQQYLRYTIQGVSNSGTGVVTAVAALPRNPHTTGSQTVTITGVNDGTTTNTPCAVCTTNSAGATVSCKAIAGNQGTTAWAQSVSFTVAEAPASATYSVLCSLVPGSGNAISTLRVSP